MFKIEDIVNTVLVGDAYEKLQQFPPKVIQSVVTSPPFFGLRNYGIGGQIGWEDTPFEYTQKLVQVFRECRRALRDDGTLWLNLGDSYNGSGKAGLNSSYQQKHTEFGRPSLEKSRFGKPTNVPGLKRKDKIGIPWRVAFALQGFSVIGNNTLNGWANLLKDAISRKDWELVELVEGRIRLEALAIALVKEGWYLRQDIIWSKPNPTPERVKDRPTTSHEYFFLFSKSRHYYYNADAIKEPSVSLDPTHPSYRPQSVEISKGRKIHTGKHSKSVRSYPEKRNKRSVWTVTTKPYKGAHFAVYPPDLIEPCILASTPGDLDPPAIVLDPFAGSGTTAFVARKLGRSAISIELKPEYADIDRRRNNSR
ncbi:DNA-methyltransferase [Leptospira langatensis]|uniref:DNA-methyltransferase n=1 Tax=Leptospira langatensis TaxID=2484983 RepID=UPI00143857CC|nr:site-specific DNA-methyltransferase [Leptospira langatensis]